MSTKALEIQMAIAVERMARAAARDSLPDNGMFNSEQLDAMCDERMPTYRRIAQVMLGVMLQGEIRGG
jgi:hypothetical protein